ncbi:MAG: TIM barrel protein [Actinomycetota bacterium]|nr:TIM barrel protein [Actinomycetota bacterium]
MQRTTNGWRRKVVGGAAAVLALGTMGVAPAGAQEDGDAPEGATDGDMCSGLAPEQVGVQLFTYRDEVGEDGLDAVVAHMAEVGMTNIERFGGTFDLEPGDFAEVWQRNGVRPVGSHGSLDLEGFEDTLAEAVALDQEYVGSGGWADPGYDTLEDTLATAANMNALGEMAREQGLWVYGHNHDREFSTVYDYDLDGDGETERARVIEILMAETDPELVTFEIDVHWARLGIAGGRDDPALAENLADPGNQDALLGFAYRYADRIQLLHVKDTAPDGDFAEVGRGTTEWAPFFEALPDVAYYFIEHDSTEDAYATAEIGFEYLTCELELPTQATPGDDCVETDGDTADGTTDGDPGDATDDMSDDGMSDDGMTDDGMSDDDMTDEGGDGAGEMPDAGAEDVPAAATT